MMVLLEPWVPKVKMGQLAKRVSKDWLVEMEIEDIKERVEILVILVSKVLQALLGNKV
jgi:hypothetical protein